MSTGLRYLNVGCGLTAPKEWTNIDSSPTLRISKIPFFGRPLLSLMKGPHWPKNIICGDIARGLRLKPASCKLIFMSHVLEHLSLPDFHAALGNVYRYLMPQGILRLIVPDLELYAMKYVSQLREVRKGEAAVDFVRETPVWAAKTQGGVFMPGCERSLRIPVINGCGTSRL